MKRNHHDICGACNKVSIEWTPEDFLLPGDIAEKILSNSPDISTTHYLISTAISERDRAWRELISNTKEENNKE
jgi:hypothetical protein